MPPKRKRKSRTKKSKNAKESPKEKALVREIKLSALNTKRYRRLWREMLMRVKMPDIERNIRTTWQTLEHALDLKDYCISLLMDGLQEAEDQRRRSNGAHTEAIDRTLKTHGARLQTVNTFFYQNFETGFVDKTHEFEDITYYRNQNEILLRRIDSHIICRNERAASLARSTALSKIDAFVDDGQNERRLIATQLQKQLEDIWDNLRNIFFDYRKSTEERRKAYEIIRRKDELDRQAIIRQSTYITYLLEEITQFRERIQSYRRDATNELREILQESNFIHNVYREAYGCFSYGREKDKQKAMTMSKEYNTSMKHLNTLVFKAERIHVYMEICRKYETQDEKILPAVIDSIMFESQQDVTRNNEDDSPFDLAAEDSECLTSFWHRLGFVQLITAELRIERDRLLMRTENLQRSVKRRFTDKTYSMI